MLTSEVESPARGMTVEPLGSGKAVDCKMESEAGRWHTFGRTNGKYGRGGTRGPSSPNRAKPKIGLQPFRAWVIARVCFDNEPRHAQQLGWRCEDAHVNDPPLLEVQQRYESWRRCGRRMKPDWAWNNLEEGG